MQTITHEELRDNLDVILRRVAADEEFLITVDGKVIGAIETRSDYPFYGL